MSRRRITRKYSRRNLRKRRSSKPLMIVLACVAFLLLCFTVSVVIGLALGKRANEYVPEPKYDISSKEYYSGDKKIRAVCAEEYKWGYGTGGRTELSVCLRDFDGFITYNSKVDVSFGEEISEGSRSLCDEVAKVHKNDGYLCGYIYVRSFEIEDVSLREIYKAYEAALVGEAAECGVDEIMLVGLEPDRENIDEIEEFVSDMSIAAGDKPLGVLLSREIFSATSNGDYRASRIRSVCDFVALDLRDVPKDEDLLNVLDGMEYYIKSYSMRLVISSKNASLLASLKKYGANNIQIIE